MAGKLEAREKEVDSARREAGNRQLGCTLQDSSDQAKQSVGGGGMRVRGERGVMGRQEGRNLEGEGKSLGFMG